MVAKYRVACFLEDAAQESLVPALFLRLVREEGLLREDFQVEVLYARGGASLGALKAFVADSIKTKSLRADLLIVGSDANCKGFVKRREWIARQTRKSQYNGVIAAIPDPHIERWYVLDLAALGRASGVKITVQLPDHKCDKNYYKHILRNAFRGTGIEPPLGGSEFGGLLAEEMDLYAAGKKEHSLADFVDGVRGWLMQVKGWK